MKKLILFIWVIFLFGCKQGPTVEQFRSCYKTLASFNELVRKKKFTGEEEAKLKAFLQEEDEKYDLRKMTYQQMLSLSRIAHLQAVNEWLQPAMKELANRQTDSACLVEYLLYNREAKDTPLTYERYMKIFAHPELMLPDYNMGGQVLNLYSKVEMEDGQYVAFVKHLMPHLNSKVHLYSFYVLTGGIWRQILSMEERFPADLKEQYYRQVLEAMRGAIAENKDKDPNIHNLESAYNSFNTLFAQGKLMGSIAPEIDFLWNSAGMNLKNLSDLRGKVVVVDFWATWCGPCVRAFPNVRKLQERYKDYPVVILGVTGIQGRHIDRLRKQTIDTKGNPEKEFRLMKEFMRDQKMTWPVAFSRQGEFQPDYGVRGVPHIFILDVEGKVRYNGLNPNAAPYEEAEKIDALLKEAGLNYPEKPMERRNYADEAAKAAEKK